MPAGLPTEGLWKFSVRTYRTPGVPEACLSLQNDFGADVNMLLFCCWASTRCASFEGKLFARANEFSSDWASGVVTPLRSARTWMKTAGNATGSVPNEACVQLREQIKAVELSAEKIQLDVLESLASTDQQHDGGSEGTLSAAAANLALYAQHRGIGISTDAREKLAVIIGAAFPDRDQRMVEKALLQQL